MTNRVSTCFISIIFFVNKIVNVSCFSIHPSSQLTSSSTLSLQRFTNPYYLVNKNRQSRVVVHESSSSGEQLKEEALSSLSLYHDGLWECKNGAVSFSITSDASNGVTQVKRSVPYTTSVTTPTNEQEPLVEVITMLNNDDITRRSCHLQQSCIDIDSVDASYSLDSTKSTSSLPASLSFVDPQQISFLIENVLATNEEERVKCFLLYGTTENEEDTTKLMRVVVAHEQKMIRKKVVITTAEQQPKLNQCEMTLMGLTLGPWLGDLIIRDTTAIATAFKKRKKQTRPKTGFGSSVTASSSTAAARSNFAEWQVGVQKAAISFVWDFDVQFKQTVTLGKSLGTQTSVNWPLSFFGTIYNKQRRRTTTTNKPSILSIDSGIYTAFLFESVYIKAPKWLSFTTKSKQTKKPPLMTEFAVFTKEENDSPAADDIIDLKQQLGSNEYTTTSREGDTTCCSLMTRLYNSQGRLQQGCTGFFTRSDLNTKQPINNNLNL